MTWRMCGLLGAALAALLSCGPSDAEAMKLKEGRSLNELPEEDILKGKREIGECPSLFCGDPNAFFCGEILFEYGRSPPLCLPQVTCRDPECKELGTICDRMECLKPDRTCVIFDGVPAQVRCIKE